MRLYHNERLNLAMTMTVPSVGTIVVEMTDSAGWTKTVVSENNKDTGVSVLDEFADLICLDYVRGLRDMLEMIDG